MAISNKISIRAFAKQIHVSDTAIRKAIKSGKFEFGYDQDAKQINPEEAYKNTWVKQQAAIKPKAGVSSQKVLKKIKSKENSNSNQKHSGSTYAPDNDENGNDSGVEIDINELITSIRFTSKMSVDTIIKKRELISLAHEKIKLEEANKILVPRDKVEKALYTIGNDLKKSLLNLPPIIVRKIMDATTEVDGITILSEAITEILGTYGNLKSNSLN